MLLWHTKHFAEREHKSTRVNVEYDHATGVSWSPDNHALLCAKHNENRLQVYKLSKKPDGTLGNPQVAVTFDKVSHGRGVTGRHNGGDLWSCSVSERTGGYGDTLEGRWVWYCAIVNACVRGVSESKFAHRGKLIGIGNEIDKKQ